MNKILISFFSFTLLLCTANTYAQQASPNPNIGCIDRSVRVKDEDLKQTFIKQGMTVYKDAVITMQSDVPFPIEVQLQKGTVYEFIYVAAVQCKSGKMELFDGDDKKLAEENISKGERPGYVIYSFSPDKTDTYLIMLTQRQKMKSACGSFAIMQQPGNKEIPANEKPGTDKN